MTTKKKQNDKDFFYCVGLDKNGSPHAYGKGDTVEKALSECKLAIQEGLVNKPSSARHRPWAYTVGHYEDWFLGEDSELKKYPLMR